MKTLSSLEVHHISRELKELEGSKVDKIYQREKSEVLFQLHKPGKGKRLLKVLVGGAIFLTSSKEEAGNPGGFSMLLRKHLSGKTLQSLRQLKPERIVQLVFSSKEEKCYLYIEFFGKGNIILCSENNLIMDALFHHEFKDRTICPKEKYTHPSLPNNLFELDEVGLSVIFEESSRDSLVTSFATDLGLGGIFAEELCTLANLNKNFSPKKVRKESLLLIEKGLATLLSHKLNPVVYSQKNQIVSVFPFPLSAYKNTSSKSFLTFSEALDYYYSHFVEKVKTSYDSQLQKLCSIIQQQEANIKKLQNQEKENKEKAETIYTHYQKIKETFKELKKAENKYSWQDIKKKLKNHKEIKEVNPKEKSIVVELNRENLKE